MPNFISTTPDSFNPLYWQTNGFEILWTGDGSPTLRSLLSPESMHHSGGAFEETQLIYGEPLRQVFADRESLAQNKVSVLSVGLGLGYNEILTAIEALKNNCIPDQVFLCSFESQQFLTDSFVKWVFRSPDSTSALYDKIAQFFINDFDDRSLGFGDNSQTEVTVKIRDVQDWLQKSFDNHSWKLFGAIEPNWPTGIPDKDLEQLKFNCIFYDAFSAKSSPHLWQEDFLFHFFSQTAQEKCHVSTYACTGALKRALKKAGFILDLQDGFRSKRNRTHAIRENC